MIRDILEDIYYELWYIRLIIPCKIKDFFTLKHEHKKKQARMISTLLHNLNSITGSDFGALHNSLLNEQVIGHNHKEFILDGIHYPYHSINISFTPYNNRYMGESKLEPLDNIFSKEFLDMERKRSCFNREYKGSWQI